MPKDFPKVLAIIPARAGSKRLPAKNTKMLLGKPLIGWSVEQACLCRYFYKVIISTDCQNIANIAQKFGAEVPFLRPQALSRDDSPSIDLVEHALQHYSTQGDHFDMIALLEPTSPLRAKEDLEKAMGYFIENYSDYDALISVGKIAREHPSVIKKIESGCLKPFSTKDDVTEAFFPYGVIYAVKTSKLQETRSFYQEKSLPYEIQRWQNFEIDDLVDFICVEKIMEAYSSQL